MRFRYTEIPNRSSPAQPFHRPYLIVRLTNGSKHKDVIALVDSGADLCLFHRDIAALIGLDVETGSELPFQGVSGAQGNAYLHNVKLGVRGMEPIELVAGFTDSIAVGTGLLGQYGFFENLNVSFHLNAGYFDVDVC